LGDRSRGSPARPTGRETSSSLLYRYFLAHDAQQLDEAEILRIPLHFTPWSSDATASSKSGFRLSRAPLDSLISCLEVLTNHLWHYLRPVIGNVGWLRTESWHSFFEVIGEPENIQGMICWGSGLRLSVVCESAEAIGGAVVRGDQ